MSPPFQIPPVGPPVRFGAQGAWLVTRYADVEAVLTSTAVEPISFRQGFLAALSERLEGRYADLLGILDTLPVFTAGARHGAARAVGERLIRPLTADTLRRDLVAEVGEELDRLELGAGPVDGVATVSRVLTDRILAAGLGLPADAMVAFETVGRRSFDDWQPAQRIADLDRRQMSARVVRGWIADHLGAGRCPALAASSAEEAALAAGMMAFVTALAADTGRSAVGNALDLLAREPALQETLRAEPGLVAAFADEALRLAGSVRRRLRIVTADGFQIGGVAIPRGAELHVRLDSAGRDPDAYPAPDRIDLDRRGPPAPSFGFGAYQCLGRLLSRAVVRAVTEAMLARYSILPGEEAPRPRLDPDLRAYAHLPLRLRPLEGRRALPPRRSDGAAETADTRNTR